MSPRASKASGNKGPRVATFAVDIEGEIASAAQRGRFARRLRQTLGRLAVAPLSVRMVLVDENGPKGGRAMRCTMTIALPRRPPLHVEHVAETAVLAFAGAIDTLERRLEKDLRKGRESARRPKKYYAAKRLL